MRVDVDETGQKCEAVGVDHLVANGGRGVVANCGDDAVNDSYRGHAQVMPWCHYMGVSYCSIHQNYFVFTQTEMRRAE